MKNRSGWIFFPCWRAAGKQVVVVILRPGQLFRPSLAPRPFLATDTTISSCTGTAPFFFILFELDEEEEQEQRRQRQRQRQLQSGGLSKGELLISNIFPWPLMLLPLHY